MGASKPTWALDWINDDSPTKYTVPSGAEQLAGHSDATNASAKMFNWVWWQVSQYMEFIDSTFDSNGNNINAPKSTTITETIAPVASCVTLDAGGIKSWDGSSNAIFSVTEAGAVTLGYSGNDVISLSAGTISVCTASSSDLVKLHAITASYGEINQLTGVTIGGSSAGDVVTIDGSQTLTNKTIYVNDSVMYFQDQVDTSKKMQFQLSGITTSTTRTLTVPNASGTIMLVGDSHTHAFSDITSGNVAAAVECGFIGNDSTPAVAKFGAMAGYYTKIMSNTAGSSAWISPSNNNVTTLNIGHASAAFSSVVFYATSINMSGSTVSLSSPQINEAVALTATSTQLNNITKYLSVDGTAGRVVRVMRVGIAAGSVSGIKCTGYNIWNGDAIATGDDIDKSDTVGYWTLDATGSILTISASGITGNCVAVLASNVSYNNVGKDIDVQCEANSNNIKITVTEAPASGTFDMTSEITGAEGLSIFITYLTSA